MQRQMQVNWVIFLVYLHPYEPPSEADLVLPTDELPVGRCVDAIIELLETKGVLG